MAVGRPKTERVLSDEERLQLRSLASSRSLPHGLITRVKIVLLSAQGRTHTAIAERLGLSKATVGQWRRRYLDQGIEGLHDELRPGRPRSISDPRIAGLIRKTLKTQPKNGTHWSCRTMAEATGISKSTVQQVWKVFGLQPHRQRSFKISTDPFFVQKVRDIVGLYLNPPDKALGLCVDQKSQVQALERTQPMLPLGWGYVEGVTHDYERRGTTTLFAALDVATGQVIGPCKRRHRHQEFLQFLRHIDKSVPGERDVHPIVDNDATHKHPQGQTLAGAPTPLSHPHHADLRLLAQSGRDRVQPDHPTSHPPRIVQERQRTRPQNRPLHLRLQCPPSRALCLDRHP